MKLSRLYLKDETAWLDQILDSQTLKNYAREVLPQAYEKAVKRTAAETGLAEDKFPPHCPYSVEDLLADD